MTTETQIEEVRQTINTFFQSYQNKDATGVLNCFVHSPKTTIIGTGKDEYRIGIDAIREQIQRDFRECETVQLTNNIQVINIQDTVAWAIGDIEFNATLTDGGNFSLPMRYSVVLTQDNSKQWKISQSHLSAPLTTQVEGESFINTDKKTTVEV